MVRSGATFQRDVLAAVPLDAEGLAVDSWVFRREPAEGEARRRLVFLHGLGDAPVSWFPALRDAFPDAELLVPALPGAGRGPLPEDRDHLPFGLTASWVRQVLHRLLDTPLPTTFIGHSMGGWFLSRGLLADPSLGERTQAPILVNPAGTWYEGVERERTLLSPKTIEDVDELTLHLYAEPPDLPVEALAAMRDTMRSASYRGLLLSTREEDFLRPDDIARLPRGTGLVWGQADRLVPGEAFDILAANLVDPRIVPLEAVGHAPHIEAPERLVGAVGRLLP